MKNLGVDLKDSEALLYVLNQLDKGKCSLDALTEQDPVLKADKMIKNSLAMGVAEVVTPQDIVSANVKLNTVFVSYIFNTKHGLEELNEQEMEEYEKVKLEWDDIEGTSEERASRFWINSLNIEDLHVSNLYEEARDGLILLKVCHKLDNTVVDWKKVDPKPNNKFKQGINC